MKCTYCGHTNAPDARFCTLCGAGLLLDSYPLEKEKQAQIAVNIEPDISGNKPKQALKATAGILIIAAAVFVCFLAFAGTPVKGGWYSEETNTALVFEDNTLRFYTLSGIAEAEYHYDKLAGKGSAQLAGEAEFYVENDKLVYNIGVGETTFIRADKEFDAEAFVRRALFASWSSKELAEVLELREDATAVLYSVRGEDKAGYIYDIAKGEGVLSHNGEESVFYASDESLDIKGAAIFAKESEGFDIKAFIEEYGNPLKGTWYDAAGNMGRFDFLDGGAYTLLSYGMIYEGSYMFSNKHDMGRLVVSGKAFDISLEGDKLIIGAWVFTRELAAQKGKDSLYAQISGVWYDGEGKSGTLEFLTDGTAIIKSQGETERARCAFNPVTGQGTITADITKQCAQRAFRLSEGKLVLGNTVYVRSFVEQDDSAIAGVWYHKDGTMGVIRFLSGGKAELELMGSKYEGTYAFNSASGEGTVSTLFGDRRWSFDIRLEGENLIIETGMFVAGEVVYTRDIVEQR